MTIFVGNLPYEAKETEIEALFEEKAVARIIFDRETNRSKGFGFVDFDTAELAKKEYARVSAKEVKLKGRVIKFGEAERKPERGNGGGERNSTGNFKPRRDRDEREARNRGYATR